MGILEELKSVGKFLQEAGKIEQYKQILDAQQRLLEMQKHIDELEATNRGLQGKLNVKESLVVEQNMYWHEKEGERDGPFCTNCWDSEGKLLRLHKSTTHSGIQCPRCKIWTRDPAAQQFRPLSHRRNPAV